MNGFINRAVAVACLGAGLAALAGCQAYDKCVDPCWPERYNAQARASVYEAFAAQAANGHVLDQTVWNWHFDPGSDTLNSSGQLYLAHLARKRPHPDPKIFLQTAQDVLYSPAAPEKLVNARNELDGKRVQAIHKYLQAQTANRPVAWDVAVHDPAEVGLAAPKVGISVQRNTLNFQGVLPISSVGGTGSGGITGGSAGGAAGGAGGAVGGAAGGGYR
jgi:hypothetical protein